MSSDDGGLRRWARRKAEAKRSRGGAAPAVKEEDGKPGESIETGQPPARAEPAEAAGANPDLPDIESLTAESDFTVFMKEGVPSALRSLALRKLWASDPLFNVIDQMVEYGEDYTKAGLAVEGLKSAWRPGKGYAREEVETEEIGSADAADNRTDGGAPQGEQEPETPAAGRDDAEATSDDDDEDAGLG